MGCHHHRAGYVPRQPLHLSIPPFDFLGLVPTAARVRADHALDAVEVEVEEVALLLSRPATVALVCRLLDALGELRDGRVS